MELTERARRSFEENLDVTARASEMLPQLVAYASERIWHTLLSQKKLLVCGVGPSAALSQQLTGALVNRYEMDRPGLPALSLVTDGAVLSAVADDSRFDEVFARQISALGQEGDLLVAITMSGQSPTTTAAISAAHDRQMTVLLLNGHDGGHASDALGQSDLEIRVPAWTGARIHECHQLIIHCICELIDSQLGG